MSDLTIEEKREKERLKAGIWGLGALLMMIGAASVCGAGGFLFALGLAIVIDACSP